MEQFLFWFGVICAALISFGFAMHGMSAYQQVKQDNCYNGLKGRIRDTMITISEKVDPKDLYTPSDVKVILGSLSKGYWPEAMPSVTHVDHED